MHRKTIMQAARSFVQDPNNCDERSVVNVVKRAVCDKLMLSYDDMLGQYPIKIGAVSDDADVVRIYVQFNDEVMSTHGTFTIFCFENDGCYDELVSNNSATNPIAHTDIFSSDPKWLLEDLRCDGGCGKVFKMDDMVYTNFDNLDYHVKCKPTDCDGLFLSRVQERVNRESASRVHMVVGGLGLPFDVQAADDAPSGN